MISIHAPTRGATLISVYVNTKISISIHAPTRGATRLIHAKFIITNISIHAPTRGATVHLSRCLWIIIFQSTLPREERHQNRMIRRHIPKDFNPRSHERSDSNIAQKICLFLYNTDNKYIIR